MDPSRVVTLIDEWNPRIEELQDSKNGLVIGSIHQPFIEKLVFRLSRLDLDALVLEDDERLVLEEAIHDCQEASKNWAADVRSARKVAGDDGSARANPVVIIRRMLSTVEVRKSDARGCYARVFVSHASEDRPLALCLAAEIEKRLPATSTFVASRTGDIPAGAWFRTIEQELRGADAYVTVITRASKNRPWVLWEVLSS